MSIPFFEEGEYVWRDSICLFNALDDELGMAWIETGPGNKKPRCTMFWSRFDGSTWSEPELLIQRDEACILEDMMVLENGALLLLWEERLVHQAKDGDRTISGSGCDVIYRAYISSDEFLIERTIEPENPLFCTSDGYSFVDDGHYIWCVFRYGSYGELSKIYRSGSEDGRVWSPPEVLNISKPVSREVFITPDGEIGVIDFEVGDQNLYLLKSSDWKNWSREKLLRTEDGIKGALVTRGRNNTMWGFVHTKDQEDELFFIHTPQEPAGEYKEEIQIVTILNILSLSCIVLLLVFVLSWIWKYKNKIQY